MCYLYHVYIASEESNTCCSLNKIDTVKQEYLVAIIFGGFQNIANNFLAIFNTGISKDWDGLYLRGWFISKGMVYI